MSCRRPRQSNARDRLLQTALAGAVLTSLTPLTVPGQPASPQNGAKSDDSGRATEVVIVTAPHGAKDIFQVPSSVDVVDGDLIEATDQSSLFEAQFEVPGLVVASTGVTGPGIALRGVSDQAGTSLAVAPHMDGVSLGKPMLAVSRMFDVERVEVLKGPQGTLWGRNSIGGSINVINRAPEDSFSSSIETAFGSFDTARANGYVNLPFGENAIRLAMTVSEGDGFIRNTLDSRRFAAQDYQGARISFAAHPGDRTSVNVTGQRVEDDGATNDLWLPAQRFLVDPDDVWLTTETLANPFLSITNDFMAVNVRSELGHLILESVTGYASAATYGLEDCANTPQQPRCIRGMNPDAIQQRSQELRIRSAADGSLEWLLGLYAFNADTTTQFMMQGAAPTPVRDTLGTIDETTNAAFGHVAHRFDGPWSVHGGLRLSRETQVTSSAGVGSADTPTRATHEKSWDNVTWRIGTEYALPNDNMVYASVATGFKGGGTSIFRRPGTGEFDDWDPEVLTAYEVGYNRRIVNSRWTLRASAFRYDIEEMQVSTVVMVGNELRTVIDNAAEAVIYGVEMSTVLSLSDRLTFSGGAVWSPRREFVDYVSAATGETLTGNTLIRAPEWSSSAAIEYRLPPRGIGSFSMRFDYQYRSSMYFRPQNLPAYLQEAYGLANLLLRFESESRGWYAFASGRNLQNTGYLNQSFIQSSAGLPRSYEMGFGLRF